MCDPPSGRRRMGACETTPTNYARPENQAQRPSHTPTRKGAIVKTCGSRSLGRFLLGLLAGAFDELSVDEGRSGADQGDEVGRVHTAPAVLC